MHRRFDFDARWKPIVAGRRGRSGLWLSRRGSRRWLRGRHRRCARRQQLVDARLRRRRWLLRCSLVYRLLQRRLVRVNGSSLWIPRRCQHRSAAVRTADLLSGEFEGNLKRSAADGALHRQRFRRRIGGHRRRRAQAEQHLLRRQRDRSLAERAGDLLAAPSAIDLKNAGAPRTLQRHNRHGNIPAAASSAKRLVRAPVAARERFGC